MYITYSLILEMHYNRHWLTRQILNLVNFRRVFNLSVGFNLSSAGFSVNLTK